MTEQELQHAVIELAQLLGWKCAHFRPAMNTRGQWMTPVAGDGAGFPDLVLVRDRVLFVELKSSVGRLRPAQRDWMTTLADAHARVHVWRPMDWKSGEIERTLR